MTTETNFFATRTLARNFLNASTAESAKFKDFGKDAPTGQRWAVLVEVAEVTQEVTQAFDPNKIAFLKQEPVKAAPVQEPTTITPGSIFASAELQTPNGKPVNVLYRRRMTAVRLYKVLANAS